MLAHLPTRPRAGFPDFALDKQSRFTDNHYGDQHGNVEALIA
jgi:hypothetical protein